jgi:hypothetical protein
MLISHGANPDGMRLSALVSHRSRRLRQFSRRLDETVRRNEVHEPGTLIGLEHEYQVFAGATQIDFRRVIRDLPLGQEYLDPGDPYAHRLNSGVVLTADGAEAELALPPLPPRPGFAMDLAAQAARARDDFLGLLPTDLRLEGYSTHLSVHVPWRFPHRLTVEYALTFSPAMMLLLDRRSSPGLLVRPRPERLELGGEHIDGVGLLAAAVFALGSILTCVSSLRHGTSRPRPPRLAIKLLDDQHRYGWFVDRRAFGIDLYAEGRRALLPLRRGGMIRAQDHLEACWAMVRESLGGFAGPDEIAVVDQVVSGRICLPCEQGLSSDSGGPTHLASERLTQGTPSVFGDVIRPRARSGFEIAPVMATWDVTVLLALDPRQSRHAFVTVPRLSLGPFIEQLNAGHLDDVLRAYLNLQPAGRRIGRRAHTSRLGLYDELGPRRQLLAADRPPARRAWRHS